MVCEVMVVVKKREGGKGPEGGREGVDRCVDTQLYRASYASHVQSYYIRMKRRQQREKNKGDFRTKFNTDRDPLY